MKRMHKMTKCGIILGAIEVIIDRYFYHFPTWFAIILFVIAWILILSGIIYMYINTMLNQILIEIETRREPCIIYLNENILCT